jgi:hypothetical protein
MKKTILFYLILSLSVDSAFCTNSFINLLDTNISKLNVPIKSIEQVSYESSIVQRFSSDLAPYTSVITQNNITLATITRSNTDYYLLTIPITPISNALESSILIYYNSTSHFIAKGNRYISVEEITKLEITDSNGDLYYSIEANNSNKIGEVIVGKSIPIDVIVPRTSLQKVRDCGNLTSGPCIRCLADACGRRWFCALIWFSNPASIITWAAGAAYACSPD